MCDPISRKISSIYCSCLPHLIFDTLIFGQSYHSTLSRSGIYRYASELVAALSQPQGQHRWPHTLLPFCPDPLLAGSAEQELAALEQRFEVALRPPGRRDHTPGPTMPQTPAKLKRLLKPIYQRLMHSAPLRALAQRRFGACLRDVHTAHTVFHTPFQSVPEAVRHHGLPHVVVTIHDMLPRIHPEFFTSETIRQFDALLEQMQPSDHVICVSESTKRDFLRWHPATPTDQVHVTPLAASPQLAPVTDPSQRHALRLQLGLQEGDQVLLSLCNLEPRKNLSTLIEAFEQLHRRAEGSAIKLVLAGSLGWKTTALTDRIRGSSAAEAILVSGHIPDEQLACLYSLADAFVYPSLYEGFGLPPLEAMQCGVPVIVGNTSSLPEVVGSAALLVDPRSASELNHALATLLGSAAERQELRQRGFAQASNFSWVSTAAQTVDVYQTMLEGHA